MDETDELVVLRVSRRRAQVDEWVLVLSAEGLRTSVRGSPAGFAVEVAASDVPSAEHALAIWQRENESAPPPTVPAPIDANAGGHALVVAAFLLALFAATGPAGRSDSAFGERGSAEASRIVAGETWRAVTALTLHADFAHVLGNATAGALFLAAVFRAFGFGVGGALALAAGALGNVANALVQAPSHATIGASTAVFGALGLLVGNALVLRRASLRGRPVWLPIGAALALLAMLGTEGERVDLWAHGLGLVAGVALGGIASSLPARWLGSRPLQMIAGASALAALAIAWAIALHR